RSSQRREGKAPHAARLVRTGRAAGGRASLACHRGGRGPPAEPLPAAARNHFRASGRHGRRPERSRPARPGPGHPEGSRDDAGPGRELCQVRQPHGQFGRSGPGGAPEQFQLAAGLPRADQQRDGGGGSRAGLQQPVGRAMLDQSRDSNRSVDHPSEQADREALVSTVHINDIIRMLRRHVWLVLTLAAVTVGAAWYFTWRAGPAYRAVAVIRLSDPRRALTGGVVDDPARADERFSDPLLSQIELMSSRTVAGAVVDSMPILRLVAEGFPDSLLSDVAMTPTAMPRTFLLSFAAGSFTLLDSGAATRVPYGTAVGSDKVRFTFGAAPE